MLWVPVSDRPGHYQEGEPDEPFPRHKSARVDTAQLWIIYCVELGGYSNYKVSRPDSDLTSTQATHN